MQDIEAVQGPLADQISEHNLIMEVSGPLEDAYDALSAKVTELLCVDKLLYVGNP